MRGPPRPGGADAPRRDRDRRRECRGVPRCGSGAARDRHRRRARERGARGPAEPGRVHPTVLGDDGAAEGDRDLAASAAREPLVDPRAVGDPTRRQRAVVAAALPRHGPDRHGHQRALERGHPAPVADGELPAQPGPLARAAERAPGDVRGSRRRSRWSSSAAASGAGAATPTSRRCSTCSLVPRPSGPASSGPSPRSSSLTVCGPRRCARPTGWPRRRSRSPRSRRARASSPSRTAATSGSPAGARCRASTSGSTRIPTSSWPGRRRR